MKQRSWQGFGRAAPDFALASGLNSEAFITWSTFGHRSRGEGVPLAGASKLDAARQAQRESYRLTCVDDAVRALAQAATSQAPRHMRSDVDRCIFGRDLDRSDQPEEAEEAEVDNMLLSRLPREVRDGRAASGRTRPETPLGRLNVGQPIAGSRPTAVRARPSSGGHARMIMDAQQVMPELEEELERLLSRRATQRARRPPPVRRAAWT
jgi:hypothetical protein